MGTLISQIEETRLLNNKQYRDWALNNEVGRFYHPWFHVAWNIGILFLLTVAGGLLVREWNFQVLGVYAFTLLLGNVAVWWLHRYPLHRRYKFCAFPYERHTVMHHRFFTQDFITYEKDLDFFAVFFPMSVIAGFTLVVQPFFFFSFKYFFGVNLAFAFCSGTSAYFLLYEFTHWSCHQPIDHWLMKVPWLAYMRHHHLVHHNPRLMGKYNFTIVYPLMDFVMGTKYKAVTLPKDDMEDHYEDVRANFPRV